MKVEVTLVTGRSINQGRGLVQGKDSELYKSETTTIELGAAVLERLGLKPGDRVVVSTPYGQGVFITREARLPNNLAFIPYGPGANRLTGDETGGSGMPVYKGLPARLGRDCGGDCL